MPPRSPDSAGSLGPKNGLPARGASPVCGKTRFSGGASRSPTIRLVHSFVTLISSWFAPGFKSAVTFNRYGGAHTRPTGFPFTLTSAISRTLSRTRNNCCPGPNHEREARSVLLYVAVPEKYFTPESELAVQDMSSGISTLAGAPQFGGNVTVH